MSCPSASATPASPSCSPWALVLGAASSSIGLLARYLGLDCTCWRDTSRVIGSGARGAYWLTFLGQPLLGQLGGAEGLARALPFPEVSLQPLEAERLLITLGEWPDAIDTAKKPHPPQYRALAQLLEPFLYEERTAGFRWTRKEHAPVAPAALPVSEVVQLSGTPLSWLGGSAVIHTTRLALKGRMSRTRTCYLKLPLAFPSDRPIAGLMARLMVRADALLEYNAIGGDDEGKGRPFEGLDFLDPVYRRSPTSGGRSPSRSPAARNSSTLSIRRFARNRATVDFVRNGVSAHIEAQVGEAPRHLSPDARGSVDLGGSDVIRPKFAFHLLLAALLPRFPRPSRKRGCTKCLLKRRRPFVHGWMPQ